jgi:hypothetical protein
MTAERLLAGIASLACFPMVFGYAFDTASGNGKSVSSGFPLSKDIPARTFATLEEANSSQGTRWAVYAYRGRAGKHPGQSPCLWLAHITRPGLYGFSSGCGPLAPSAGRSVPPVIVSLGLSMSEPNGRTKGESFHALTFATNVHAIELKLSSGASVRVRTRLLNARQSEKAAVTRFRYVARVFRRDVCIAGVQGFDRSGGVVLEDDFDDCEASAR